MRFQIYGDSLMKAVQVDSHYKYKATAQGFLHRLQQETGVEVTNHAHFGYTSTKGQTVLQRDLEKGLTCQLALLEFGGNDCDHNWAEVAAHPDAEHAPNTPLPQFLGNLKSMASSLQTNGVQPLLMTLPPLDAQKYLDYIDHLGSNSKRILAWLGDVQMIYRWQEMYSGAIAVLANQLSLPLIDIRSQFLSRRDCCSLIARDGIHLTEAGYDLVFQTIRDTLLTLA